MQNRRTFLKNIFYTAPFFTVGLNGCNKKNKRPHVILVMTDDMGYGDMSCHGNPYITTPNLDRLHSQSTRLTNFHVSPYCSPTRASLMSGQYANRVGVWRTTNGRDTLYRDADTIAEVFKENGYRTAMFGKWHIGANYPYRPQDRGFEHTVTFNGGGVANTPDYWGNDCYDDMYLVNGTYKKIPGYGTDVYFDQAMKYIENHRNEPFFVYLPTRTPHGPYYVPEKYTVPFKNKGLSEYYYGMLANIDENMGRLMHFLDEKQLARDTILIFMTDNGRTGWKRPNGFNAGMRGGKGSCWDGGHRVPFFIRWPGGGIQAGKDIDRLTAHLDLFPTFMDLCHLETNRSLTLDGKNIAPMLFDQSVDWTDRTIIVSLQSIHTPRKWGNSSVMTERWRLINGKKLYDIKQDPGQKTDIAAEHPDVVKALRQTYEIWWADVSRRFDEHAYIVIGSEHENPAMLTGYDWDMVPLAPWNQRHIRAGEVANGNWYIEVAREGDYEFRLQRWPKELGKAIQDTIATFWPENDMAAEIPRGVSLKPDRARLRIADFDETKPVNLNATSIVFNCHLKPGKTTMKTWFIENDKTIDRGAYYVYVERL